MGPTHVKQASPELYTIDLVCNLVFSFFFCVFLFLFLMQNLKNMAKLSRERNTELQPLLILWLKIFLCKGDI